jgi:hypothetical protein
MKNSNDDHIERLLKQALPPVESDAAPARDLWPVVLERLDAQAVPHRGWLWFDCALAAGLVAVVAVFPAAIPVLLYYL